MSLGGPPYFKRCVLMSLPVSVCVSVSVSVHEHACVNSQGSGCVGAGGFVIDKSKQLELVVPDLTGFKVPFLDAYTRVHVDEWCAR